jgi:pimeloyl-ACP methyl ester carboxylesterase
VVAQNGATHVERARPAPNPAVDCFYVYPTISGQATINANLVIGLRERAVALAEAARFSQVCRVYAPVYRQVTLSALRHPGRITREDALVAYDSVRSAFRDYLAHYNHARGIVLIGHSQGATILIRLLQQEIDGRSSVRRRLVSALLLGGNVTVRKDRSTGGDFNHIPACASDHETGCVVAYSSFTSRPPSNSQFGRTTSDAGVRLLAPAKPSPELRIMCVNPAAPAGGSASLAPYLPSFALSFLPGGGRLKVKTPWVSFPGEYSARCESSGNATWLQVTHVGTHDRRPQLAESGDAIFGLHVLDVNIALGNLVRLIRDQAAAFAR